jgi:hypothetical protein
MKKEFLLLVIVLFFTQNIRAKDTSNKDTTKVFGWHPDAWVGLNISQIAFKDWSQGGENSLTWSSQISASLKYYSQDSWEFINNLTISYGRTKLSGQDARTNDNEIYLESILSKNVGWTVNPFFSNSIRTPVTTGYDYTQNTQTAIVDFFDPAYITQSLGLTYNENPIVKTRLGIATQETFDNKYRQYTNDTSITRAKAFKLDTGVESVTNLEVAIAENIKLQSSLRLFSRFESMDVWDVRWESIIIGKINSFLNMNFSYLLIYQKDQSLRTQMKEGLNVGFVYEFL